MGTLILLLTLFHENTARFDLPPKLLESICYTESKFKVNAIHKDDGNESSLGVCQIKLKTARLMGFHGDAKELMKPDLNVFYAAKYLSHQIHRYKGDVHKAIVSYNRGSAGSYTKTQYSERVVKRWLLVFDERDLYRKERQCSK